MTEFAVRTLSSVQASASLVKLCRKGQRRGILNFCHGDVRMQFSNQVAGSQGVPDEILVVPDIPRDDL